jgi:phosphatidate cytidylyltransferase
MLQRSKSAVGVVIAGLVPVAFGGPVWAAAWALFCLVGVVEYERFVVAMGAQPPRVVRLAVPLAAAAALTGQREAAIVAILGGGAAIAMVEVMRRPDLEGAFVGWAYAVAALVYLGLPAFAAVALRQTPGDTAAAWLRDLADRTAFGWEARPEGLAWLLLALVVTWLSDTGQYLVGRSLGKHKLSPRISPKKTIEGLAGGAIVAMGAGALAVSWFGLGVHPLAGALIGAGITIVGVTGDLAESLMKRQAGVKDSGSFIPGHGGMLDRIDSLLFGFTAAWLFVALVDRYLA